MPPTGDAVNSTTPQNAMPPNGEEKMDNHFLL
jgi:hypothetical protein